MKFEDEKILKGVPYFWQAMEASVKERDLSQILFYSSRILATVTSHFADINSLPTIQIDDESVDMDPYDTKGHR